MGREEEDNFKREREVLQKASLELACNILKACLERQSPTEDVVNHDFVLVLLSIEIPQQRVSSFQVESIL